MRKPRRRPKDEAPPPDEARTRRFDPLAIALEASIIVLLGFILAGLSIELLLFQYGDVVTFDAGDLITAAAAGVAAGAVVRLTVRLHRRWKKTIGRYTAAAALCALAAAAGALVVMVPSECPGGLFSTGRCGVREAAAWGQVAGLGAVLNFMVAGFALAFWRLVRKLVREIRSVIRDGSEQGVIWFKALRNIRRRRAGAEKADETARGPQDCTDMILMSMCYKNAY